MKVYCSSITHVAAVRSVIDVHLDWTGRIQRDQSFSILKSSNDDQQQMMYVRMCPCDYIFSRHDEPTVYS